MIFEKLFKSFWKLESLALFLYFRLFFKRTYYDISHKNTLKTTLFIFGSGSSLKNISDRQFNLMNEKGHTLGFNAVVDLEKINWDYFIIREFEQKIFYFSKFTLESIFNFSLLKHFTKKIRLSNFFSNTKFFICSDQKCGQSLLWLFIYGRYFRNKFFYTNKYNRNLNWPPSETFKNIPHANATLNDAINIGYLLGYDEIVLVGVDLYDSRYFYLDDNETRDFDIKKNRNHLMKHNTTDSIINTLKYWKTFLDSKKKNIKVFNPKSLAADFLEVYYL